ncbi:hypothetical protein [Sinomonas sp.]|uniref:hypothetical protein n=1 Tax=Sinomonas sp. TaxID=1914986 RepID=UPI002BC8E51D|nr:hypothetical protein [Sinomonas sp.]
MPVVSQRTVVPPTWMRVSWWRLGFVAFAIVCFGGEFVFRFAVFPMVFALGLAWVLWRNERDNGRH